MPVPWWGNTWWCSGPSHISYLVVKLCICYFQWMYLVQKRSFIPLQVVFRSTSAMVYIFIQMSCEMWDFDIYGTWLTGLPGCEWQELSFLSVLWNCCYDVFLPPLENWNVLLLAQTLLWSVPWCPLRLLFVVPCLSLLWYSTVFLSLTYSLGSYISVINSWGPTDYKHRKGFLWMWTCLVMRAEASLYESWNQKWIEVLCKEGLNVLYFAWFWLSQDGKTLF